MKIKRKELQQITYWWEQRKRTTTKEERKEIDKKIKLLSLTSYETNKKPKG